MAKTLDRYFYKEDELKVFDCSVRGFPKNAPAWVVEAIANHKIDLGVIRGMRGKHWFLRPENAEDDTVTILDDKFTLLISHKGKISTMPKAIANMKLAVVRDKISRKSNKKGE